VAARYSGRSPVDCMRFGVACGAQSTQHFGAGLLDVGKVERLFGEVVAERVEIAAEISSDVAAPGAITSPPGSPSASRRRTRSPAKLRPIGTRAAPVPAPVTASIAATNGCRLRCPVNSPPRGRAVRHA
jgi:hypothetical protein